MSTSRIPSLLRCRVCRNRGKFRKSCVSGETDLDDSSAAKFDRMHVSSTPIRPRISPFSLKLLSERFTCCEQTDFTIRESYSLYSDSPSGQASNRKKGLHPLSSTPGIQEIHQAPQQLSSTPVMRIQVVSNVTSHAYGYTNLVRPRIPQIFPQLTLLTSPLRMKFN